MQFGVLCPVRPWNQVLDVDPDPPRQRLIFWEGGSRVAQCNVRRECGASHAKMAEPIKLSFTMVSEVGLVIIYYVVASLLNM